MATPTEGPGAYTASSNRDRNYWPDTQQKGEQLLTNTMTKTAKVALKAAAGAGGVFAWANPEGVTIHIHDVSVEVTTAATGACTLDIGTTAVSAATASDNLIDGLDVNAATGLFDSNQDGGTNGKRRQRLPAGKWVTASVASGTVTGLAGYAYIAYNTA